MNRILVIFLLFAFNLGFSQKTFLEVETNKVLCVINFIETACSQIGTSISYHNYIKENIGLDKEFERLISEYDALNLNYGSKRQEYPNKRRANFYSKDLIWIADSNSTNINDFSERIIGYLPHNTHSQLLNILIKIESYYDRLVWDREQSNIKRIEKQLSRYTETISDLYLDVSSFYNTNWNVKIPFKISLYPIPLKKGNSIATPMGNALICGFLSHNKEDYKGQLGIIMHEMCHVLFGEQRASFQHKINEWFGSVKSPYTNIAYSYIDEALATAIGNGWAYEKINGHIDNSSWYNNKYIDGYAHALFPILKQYMNDKRSIDEAFVKTAIDVFAEKFPSATNDMQILMNEIQVHANSENENEIDMIFDNIYKNFRPKSTKFLSPINTDKSLNSLKNEGITKLIIVESKNKESIKILDNSFASITMTSPLNTITAFKDISSNSSVIIVNIDGVGKLEQVFIRLKEINLIKFNTHYEI